MQIVFLTGCANGIGRHLATVFYQRGDAVVITDVDEAGIHNLTAAWDPDRVLVARLDVRNLANWRQIIDQTLARWGRIDIGLNVAGVLRAGYVSRFDPADIDFIIDINVKGVLLGSHLLAEQMVKQSSGHIINIASLAALSPVLGMSLYSASKFAVRGVYAGGCGRIASSGRAGVGHLPRPGSDQYDDPANRPARSGSVVYRPPNAVRCRRSAGGSA